MQETQTTKDEVVAQAQKDTTQVGKVIEPQVPVVQVSFRIAPELSVRVGTLAAQRRTNRRALWIAAMESYLSTVPTTGTPTAKEN